VQDPRGAGSSFGARGATMTVKISFHGCREHAAEMPRVLLLVLLGSRRMRIKSITKERFAPEQRAGHWAVDNARRGLTGVIID
jgi:hypothetical protein